MPSGEDHQDAGARGAHFRITDAGARAREAWRKSEFILSRAWDLLSKPKKEWRQIRDEETSVPSLLFGYVAPLAAITPIASLIGSFTFRSEESGDFSQAVVRAVLTWLVSIALVYLLGFLINALADNFDADRNELAAQKIAAYSLTPAFLSGLFELWPPLWWLSLFPLAATVFLMFRGLPVLLNAPEERALSYAAMVTVAGLVAVFVLFSLVSCVT
jgi:hypothetical protein